MLGIQDPFVLFAYFGIIVTTLSSLVYGMLRRNAARDEVTQEDRQWAIDEEKVDNDL